MASRRRRRKSIGKVVTDVERRVRRVEKRPGATRLKRNVVTGEKIQYRAIPTKAIQADAITANEAEFGVPVVSDTEPTDYLKAGTLWVNPDDGSAKVYDLENNDFVPISDVNAQASADGKNTIYRQDSQPSGGTYVTGDVWFDTDDDNKIYRYNSATTTWVGFTLGNNALASISANKITAGTIDANVITVSNLDAGKITAGTLTGSTVRTSATGKKVLIDGSNNHIRFDDIAGATSGYITPLTIAGVGDYGIFMHSGSTVDTTGGTAGAGIYIADFATRIYAQGRSSFIDMSLGNITIQADNSALAYVLLDSVEVIVGELTGYAKSQDPTSEWRVRNIKATSTAGTPSGGLAGDIMLVYT